jgi:hypothetical protein
VTSGIVSRRYFYLLDGFVFVLPEMNKRGTKKSILYEKPPTGFVIPTICTVIAVLTVRPGGKPWDDDDDDDTCRLTFSAKTEKQNKTITLYLNRKQQAYL